MTCLTRFAPALAVKRAVQLAVACVAVLVTMSGQVQANILYSYGDGSAEGSLAGGVDYAHIWLNAFTVVAGGEKINSVDIAFGSNGNVDPPPNGTAMTA